MRYPVYCQADSLASAYTVAGQAIPCAALGVDSFSCQAVCTVDTPSAQQFANTAVTTGTDTITKTAHGFTTGLKGQLTTTGGLPAPLALATDYFIIKVDADNFKLATTLNNATAGTAIDITTQGTGNHTFTPTALAGASIKLQESNDGSTWDDISGSSTNITVTADVWLSQASPRAAFIRPYLTLTAGHITAALNYCCKGDIAR